MGDPAGCGPQITAAAWSQLSAQGAPDFAVIADPAVFADLCPVTIIDNLGDTASIFATALPVIALGKPLPHTPVPGQPDIAFVPAIIESIETATALALTGQVAGIVTNPISKAALYEAGFRHPGHTEFIAALCGSQTGRPIEPVMMLIGGGLRVALATIHIPLMHVGRDLSSALLIEIARITTAALTRDFGIAAPRIAFTGLNPHAGEDGNIGREEIDIINPAAAALRQQGLDISDARPADTVFHEALSGAYDAVIAMTHDQALIPVKTLDFWGGVNTTLGLPIIRASPDHGTAYDAAATASCRADSLLAAIACASEMAVSRATADG